MIFFDLPNELQRMIVSKLDIVDRYYLQLAFNQFESELFLPTEKHINCSMDIRFDKALARKLLGRHIRPSQITSLNLNGIYWIPAADLRKYIFRMVNVQKLYLIDTKIGLEHTDIALFNSLEQLRVVYVYHKQFESIRKRVVWKKLRYRIHRVVPIDSPYWFEDYERGYCSYGIRSEGPLSGTYVATNDWMNLLCGVEEHTSFSKAVVLKFTDLLGGEQNPEFDEKQLTRYSDHESITIVNRMSRHQFPYGAYKLARVSFRPIFEFKNLTHLTLEVDSWTDILFMEPLVTTCIQLKFLKIINYTPRFALSHLHLAPNLQDISYHSTQNFQLAKFLDEVMHKKFRRIFLRFPTCSNLNYGEFEKFININSRMMLFGLMTAMPMTFTRYVKMILERIHTEPHQVFKVFTLKDLGDHIPLAHMDMAHVCYNSNGKFR